MIGALPDFPPELNSADRVVAAAKLLPKAWVQNLSLESVALDIEFFQLHPRHRPSSEVTAALRAALADTSPALAEAEKIADCPAGRVASGTSPLLLSPTPNAMNFLNITRRLLYPKLVLRLEDGDTDGALSDARAIIYTARPPAEFPRLLHAQVSALIREMAAKGIERNLAQGESSPAALAEARRLFETEAGRTLLLPALRGQRANIEDTIRALDDGRLRREVIAETYMFADYRSWTGWAPADRWSNRMTGADFRRANAVALLRHHTRVVEWLKESPDGLKVHDADWAALRAGMSGTARVSANDLSQYVANAHAHDARFRCAAVALAAEQFRQETGLWPASLDELVSKYRMAVPCDPCDLQPLRIAHRPDGIVIYWVGANATDEGGAIASDGAAKETDTGIRLWDVDKRRQPPLPPKGAKKR